MSDTDDSEIERLIGERDALASQLVETKEALRHAQDRADTAEARISVFEERLAAG